MRNILIVILIIFSSLPAFSVSMNYIFKLPDNSQVPGGFSKSIMGDIITNVFAKYNITYKNEAQYTLYVFMTTGFMDISFNDYFWYGHYKVSIGTPATVKKKINGKQVGFGGIIDYIYNDYVFVASDVDKLYYYFERVINMFLTDLVNMKAL